MMAGESRDLGTWIALFGLAVIALCLLGLMAMVAPHLLGVIVILAGFLGFGALHYVLWGWWLGPLMKEHPPEESREGTRSAREK